jgi:hypothetical protein
MTVGHYCQQLQVSLDDTVPGRPGLWYTLEESQQSNYAGQVHIHKTGKMWPLLDREELAPDLCGISSLQDLTFFVQVKIVWGKARVIRPIQLHELFSIWDYNGKLEGNLRTPEQLIKLLLLRLMLPLGTAARKSSISD